MSEDEKKCGDCIINWEDDEEEEDEDEYGPYASPHESRRAERQIDREHAKRLQKYKETGEWD